MKRELYPSNWPEISLRIRERDGWKCKWCGVENGAVGSRDKKGRWHSEDEIIGMDDESGYELFGQQAKRVKIVLTVAHHPDPDPMNCSDDNLHSLCQGCHNRVDAPMRTRHAAETRRKKKIRAGQMELP